MRKNVTRDSEGRLCEVGKIYFVGSVLQVMRYGDPLVLDAEVTADELDNLTEKYGSIRIFTKQKRKKRRNIA